ncbi:hypothetical protein MN112_08445 [Staphylococcus epidermidis]|jgi:hypothetical protein|uniref:Lipoprotein n=1 Tax=Staphylococcus phage HS14 TaxID=3056404 RepID=A0AA49X8H1_9VIRU|nr:MULTISPECIES: hypothetical protein [Staphylococcus]MDU4964860.1 hypothetical protein [Staphylococcus warneri]WLJ25997.1 MAG: protein of unknown function (DUF4969) [Staphylococcus phage HS14]EJE25562.1 hypothetical protein HMPREF9976_02070 [Staphylococcus epidermidis NIHLM003]KDP68508.1 putative lipoprotein [Staphylococcus epidermidis VCU111]MBE9439698.1 hypothetical protein [Staphylococcus epidermidis]
MKKVLFLIFASLLVLGACGNNDSEKKEDNKTSEHKKSNDPKKDKKLENKDKSNKNTNDDKQEVSSDDSNNDTANNESESTSKNDNKKTQSANSNNERPQGKTVQPTQQNHQQQSNNNQQSQNNNGYMTQEQINEWNKNKPTTHDESQMGYGRGDYEQARKDSEKVWNDPNAHVGGPRWVGKNEGYESWAKRQQEVQNSIAE